MESKGFFGFDTTLPPDEDHEGEGIEEEYNALNEETFGSAALGGDWEESHEHFSEGYKNTKRNSLSKSGSSEQDDKNLINSNDFIESLNFDKSLERRRLFERKSGDGVPLSNSFGNGDAFYSPGGSIWSPTQGLETLRLMNKGIDRSVYKDSSDILSNSTNQNLNPAMNVPSPLSNTFPSALQRGGGFSLNGSSSGMHSVNELEDQLRQFNTKYESPIGHQKAIRLEDFEKEIISKRSPGITSPPAASLPQSLNDSIKQEHLYLSTHSPNLPNLRGPPQDHPHYANPPIPGMSHNEWSHHVANHMQRVMKNNMNFHMNHPPPPINNQLMNQRMAHNHQRQHGYNIDNSQVRNFPRQNNDRRYLEHRSNHHDNNGRKEFFPTGNRIRRDSDAEWEDWAQRRSEDEYNGLMTPNEKRWLRNIQNMQLQTENPYQDDYYYIMLTAKQQKHCEDDVMIELDDLKTLLSQKSKEGKEYEPPQLEKSLGKLQVVSVNAPRKIIDIPVINLDSNEQATALQRDMRRHKGLLNMIEKLYIIQIELDDLQRKIRALPDCPTRDIFCSKCRHLVDKVWKGLVENRENFVQVLCIKKGKKLVSRIAAWVGDERIENLLATVIQNLSLLSKKDKQDEALNLLWPISDRFLANANVERLITLGTMMISQCVVQRNNFIPSVDNKLGLSLTLGLIVRGEAIWSELEISFEQNGWNEFLQGVVEAMATVQKRILNGGGKSILPQPSALPSLFLAKSSPPSVQLKKCTKVDNSSLELALSFISNLQLSVQKAAPLSNVISPSISIRKTSNEFQPFDNGTQHQRYTHSLQGSI